MKRWNIDPRANVFLEMEKNKLSKEDIRMRLELRKRKLWPLPG